MVLNNPAHLQPHRAAASPFRSFNDQLYCSGAVERKCRLRNGTTWEAGNCFYDYIDTATRLKRHVFDGLFDRDTRLQTKQHTFDPNSWGVHHKAYHHFDAERARNCVKNKNVFIAGDSTTRDTFYEFAAVAGLGHIAFENYYPPPDHMNWENSAQMKEPNGDYDAAGRCTGNVILKGGCQRVVEMNSTRIYFQFLTAQSVTRELDVIESLANRTTFDFAFVQCPMYEYLNPNAYNYSLTKEERARPMNDTSVGEKFLSKIGKNCRQYFDHIAKISNSQTQIFNLGITPLPGWTKTILGDTAELKITRSIHRGLGISCHANRSSYHLQALSSSPVITAIDRFNTVGLRRRDFIHPLYNAQFAVVQLMLNHMCPLRQELHHNIV